MVEALTEGGLVALITEHDWGFSPYVQKKAATAARSIRADEVVPMSWWVASADGESDYYTKMGVYDFNNIPWASCTCTHGMNNQGQARCYHVAAAVEALRKEA